jgi:hypothetical protein
MRRLRSRKHKRTWGWRSCDLGCCGSTNRATFQRRRGANRLKRYEGAEINIPQVTFGRIAVTAATDSSATPTNKWAYAGEAAQAVTRPAQHDAALQARCEAKGPCSLSRQDFGQVDNPTGTSCSSDGSASPGNRPQDARVEEIGAPMPKAKRLVQLHGVGLHTSISRRA